MLRVILHGDTRYGRALTSSIRKNRGFYERLIAIAVEFGNTEGLQVLCDELLPDGEGAYHSAGWQAALFTFLDWVVRGRYYLTKDMFRLLVTKLEEVVTGNGRPGYLVLPSTELNSIASKLHPSELTLAALMRTATRHVSEKAFAQIRDELEYRACQVCGLSLNLLERNPGWAVLPVPGVSVGFSGHL